MASDWGLVKCSGPEKQRAFDWWSVLLLVVGVNFYGVAFYNPLTFQIVHSLLHSRATYF